MKFENVYNIVKQIPSGRVITYGTLAALSGLNNPRHAGRILHENPDPENIPCHRIVNAQGRVAPAYAFGGADIQKQRLMEEGVIFTEKGFVDMNQCNLTIDQFPV